jgi:hypothetical protein
MPEWIDYVLALPVLYYRKLKYGYSFRRIPLGQGIYTIVDQQDYYRLNHFNWIPKGSGERSYAVRLECDSQHIKFLSMHREIMGSPKGLQIDHRNRSRLDNRRENLRTATNSQNQYNKNKTKRKTSSIYIGVTYVKSTGKWRAQIMLNRKNINLGDFDEEIEAAKAYDRGAIKYHTEFARLNFPGEDYNPVKG